MFLRTVQKTPALYQDNTGIKNLEREKYGAVGIWYHIAHPSSLPSHNSLPAHPRCPLPDPSTMPCVVQPGGGGGRIRVRYTVCRKHGLIATSKWLVAKGMMLQKAATDLHVSHFPTFDLSQTWNFDSLK